MQRFYRAPSAAGLILLLGSLAPAFAQGGQAAPQKKVKDQGEYDLYNGAIKESDANKKLQLLNTWVEKYPNTDFKEERLGLFNAISQAGRVLEVGDMILGSDPKNLTALYLMTLNTQKLGQSPKPEQLALGEKAANGLLTNLEALFAADKKPAATSETDWKKAKDGMQLLAQTTLGWIAMTRKDNAAAEREFLKSLQLHGDNALVSYWTGLVLYQQKKVPEALYHFARATELTGPGALDPATRKQIDDYLVRAYNGYHGKDDAGLQQLRALAVKAPLPPPDFKIKSVKDLADEASAKEEQFRKDNPELALWLNIKTELSGPNGAQYFDSSMKGAAVPKLSGRLISQKPAVNPKELVLAMDKPDVPEATLKLDAALAGKAEPGTVIAFEGVPNSYSKEPLMVFFDVEKAKLSGWPAQPKPAVRRPTTKKSGAGKKG